jgi:hypothetical protein
MAESECQMLLVKSRNGMLLYKANVFLFACVSSRRAGLCTVLMQVHWHVLYA